MPESELDPDLQYGTHPLHQTFIELYDAGVELTQMKPNAWRRPRFFHLTQIVGLTAGLPGATAEAGCFRGLASFLMCHYLRRWMTMADTLNPAGARKRLLRHLLNALARRCTSSPM